VAFGPETEGARVPTKSSTTAWFGPPDRGKGALSRAKAGRLCDYPGCATVLSTYNSAATCFLHSAPTLRHPLASR
jgi:hypothetical protein